MLPAHRDAALAVPAASGRYHGRTMRVLESMSVLPTGHTSLVVAASDGPGG